MNPTRPQSLADKEAEARKNSVLLNYAYHCTPTNANMCYGNNGKLNPKLWRLFGELVDVAVKYKQLTGRQLPILGELGELFAEIELGIKRHGPMTQGSDGKLGNDFVEVKTITPDKKTDTVQVKRAGNFGKLVVVKITDDFQFGARMVDRKILEEHDDIYLKISWDAMIKGEPDLELHRSFPFKKALPKRGTG